MTTYRDKFYTFAANHIRPSLLERDKSRKFDRGLWLELCQTGLFHSLIDEKLKNKQKLQSFCDALYSISYGGMDVPFIFTAVAQGLVISLLEKYGTETQKRAYLGSLVNGELIAAICNAEAGAGTNIKSLQSTFELQGDHGLLNADKNCSTNVPEAGLLLVSAWTKAVESKPLIEIFIIEDKKQSLQKPLDLAGMWTGAVGSCKVVDQKLNYDANRLGATGNGLSVFKACFNLERLFVPTVICGVLKGIEQDCLHILFAETEHSKRIKNMQFIQEKMVTVYKTHEILLSLLNHTFASFQEDFDTKHLAITKQYASEEGLEAALAYFELLGGRGYATNNISQKITRDFLALKALGGTKELQKNDVFTDLERAMKMKTFSKDLSQKSEAKDSLQEAA